MKNQLETLSHPKGAVIVGWVAPRVLYVRFVETLPAQLGLRYAFHLGRLLKTVPSLQYFADCTELENYEPRSGTAIREVMLTHKERLESIHIAVSSRPIEMAALGLCRALGVELARTCTRSEFETKLMQVAPRVNDSLNPRTWKSVPPASLVPPRGA